MGTGLKSRTLGIIGFGRIGRLVAHYGRAFGMDVVVLAMRAESTHAAEADGFELSRSARTSSKIRCRRLSLEIDSGNVRVNSDGRSFEDEADRAVRKYEPERRDDLTRSRDQSPLNRASSNARRTISRPTRPNRSITQQNFTSANDRRTWQ